MFRCWGRTTPAASQLGNKTWLHYPVPFTRTSLSSPYSHRQDKASPKNVSQKSWQIVPGWTGMVWDPYEKPFPGRAEENWGIINANNLWLCGGGNEKGITHIRRCCNFPSVTDTSDEVEEGYFFYCSILICFGIVCVLSVGFFISTRLLSLCIHYTRSWVWLTARGACPDSWAEEDERPEWNMEGNK